MEFVHYAVELIEKVRPFSLKVFNLLEFDLELPLSLLVAPFNLLDLLLILVQFFLNLKVDDHLLLQIITFSLGLLQRLRHIFIGPVMLSVIFLRHLLFLLARR